MTNASELIESQLAAHIIENAYQRTIALAYGLVVQVELLLMLARQRYTDIWTAKMEQQLVELSRLSHLLESLVVATKPKECCQEVNSPESQSS